MSGWDGYHRPFDPTFRLERLSRAALARLGREYMLLAHIHDRAIMPLVAQRWGAQAMTDLANDEWMGASPVFNERNRRQLGIEGDGVPAIMKGLQFDVGAPHQYMDFRFEVVDETRGFFWLRFCGAYTDVARFARGDPGPVIQLCHHMEDRTFDATVMAVNPRARCRPVHRPPLAADHAGPVCRWEVTLTGDAATVEEREITRIVRRSKAAGFVLSPAAADGGDGMHDYHGPFRPDLALEDLSHGTLARQCREFALDVHLLVRAALTAIAGRHGEGVAREIARLEWAGAAPVYVRRVRAALGIEGDDMDAILKTLQVDPAFPHEYVDFGCRRVDAKRGYFWVNPCAALADDEPRGWLTLLADAETPGFDAVVAAVNPRARCRPIAPAALGTEGARALHAWEIVIDEDAEALPEPGLTQLVRLSSVAGFAFRAGPDGVGASGGSSR
jgi:hypothetical protein